MVTKIKYAEEKPGNLAFMVSWTSLDGRPQIAYYDTIFEAGERSNHLTRIGRTNSIFHLIEDFHTEKELLAKEELNNT